MPSLAKLAHDDVLERDLFVLDLPTPDAFPADLRLTTPRFVCLLAWDARSASAERISAIARRLLEQGAIYVCIWGPDCQRVHDIVDQERDVLAPAPDVDCVVMTTWHENETLSEAIHFALVSAWPDEPCAENCGATLGVAIGSPAWAADIRAAFENPRLFILQLNG